MATVNDSLEKVMELDGCMGVVLVDSSSGMVLGKAGGGVNLDIAAAGNTEVVKAKLKTMQMLGLKESIEDILITLTNQYHIIRPKASNPALFMYVVLDKKKSNLAMARFKLAEVEAGINV